MEKIKENILIGLIIIGAVALYFVMPYLLTFIVNNIHGTRGLILRTGAVLVFLLAFFLMGYRGKTLLYILLLLLFVARGIWLYFNYRDIDTYISGRYGQLAATAVFVAIILLIWLFVKFML